MRPDISAGLLSFLQSGTEFKVVELWEIAPVNQAALYFTSAESSKVYDGHTYTELDLERGDIEEAVGIQVSTLDFDVVADAVETVAGQTWQAAAIGGYFDGATVTLRLLFFSDWQTQVGAVTLFTGTIAEISVKLGTIHFTAKSLTEVFNQMFPRNLYQSNCRYLLYDDNCGVDRDDFDVAGAVETGSDEDVILCAALNQAEDYFALGYVEFTSGDMSGQRRTVESSESGRLDLAVPFPQAPDVGDTFNVYPGCDRTKATCNSKFSNDRFGGEPFIPVPEVLY